MSDSTLSSWLLVLWRALESYRLAPQDPFRQAGLDPARLQDPNARYPFANIQRLWRLATEASGDPCFGLRVAGLCHPTTFHALGYAWLASSTLREAMQRLIRYQIEQLPSGQASEESVAAAPHLSPRMLQCKLREEGTGFKQILEDMRRQLAMQYVQNSQISLNEITYLLGFSEPSNFTRAFRRWTGVAPSAYRN